MNKFSALESKAHKVVLYVPSMIDNQVVDNSDMIKTVVSKMVYLFGGATVIKGRGHWYNDEMSRVDSEDVAMVCSNADVLHDQTLDQVYELAELVRLVMRQWCVSVEIDGKLYFV